MARTLRASLALVLSVMWLVAAAAPASAGGGGCHAALSDQATDEIKVAMNCFTPTVARVVVGDTVTWFSGTSEAPHTVTAANEAFAAGNGDLPSGKRLSASFDEPGVYPYACLLHPGMVAAIVVGDHGNDGAAAAVPPVGTAAGVEPTADTISGTPAVAVGASLLLLLVAGVVAVRRHRTRPTTPPSMTAG